MPLVSVIMPSLNVADYIGECIESVLNQTLKDIEIICVDAGSTDGTREIINKYMMIDKRIKLFTSDIKSYGYQVNLGFDIASGEYVAIVETDDYIDNNMYEQLYLYAKKNDLDYIRANYDNIININGNLIIETQEIFNDKADYYKIINADINPEVFLKDNSIWSGIYKKSFLKKNNIILNETLGAAFQDIGFKLLTLFYAQRIMYIPYSGYRYRVEREGCSTCNDNVLRYAWQEFDRIINLADLINTRKFKYIIRRMINVFICEYNKLILKSVTDNDNKSEYYSSYILPYYNWFKDKINMYIEECVEYIDNTLLTNLTQLLNDEKKYKNTLICNKNSRNKYWNNIFESISDKPIVIVSYGIRGKEAYKQFLERKKNVVAICDNNESIYQTNKLTIPILPMYECVKKYKKNIYIIPSEKYAVELTEQLKILGVSQENIVTI